MRKSMFRAYAFFAAVLGFGLSQGAYLMWLAIAYADVYTPSLATILTFGLSVVAVGVAGAGVKIVHWKRRLQQRQEDVERLTREFEEFDKNNVVGTERREKLFELQEAITRLQR